MGGALSVALVGHLEMERLSAQEIPDVLFKAVSKGNVDLLREILASPHVNVNCKNNKGETPLILATRKGHLEVVKYLLTDEKTKGSINVNEQDRYGRTALMWGAIWNREEILTLLLNFEGIQIDLKDENGNTALIQSIRYERIKLFKQLLSRGASVEITNNKGDSALTWAALSKNISFIYQVGLKKPRFDFKDVKIKKAFILAAFHADKDRVPYLFSAVRFEKKEVDLKEYPCVQKKIDRYKEELIKVKRKRLIDILNIPDNTSSNRDDSPIGKLGQELVFAMRSELLPTILLFKKNRYPSWYHCRLKEDFLEIFTDISSHSIPQSSLPPSNTKKTVTFRLPLSKKQPCTHKQNKEISDDSEDLIELMERIKLLPSDSVEEKKSGKGCLKTNRPFKN